MGGDNPPSFHEGEKEVLQVWRGSMTTADITSEADYRWQERAGIYAGNRELTEQERVLTSREILAFENQERSKPDTQNESKQPTPKGT